MANEEITNTQMQNTPTLEEQIDEATIGEKLLFNLRKKLYPQVQRAHHGHDHGSSLHQRSDLRSLYE